MLEVSDFPVGKDAQGRELYLHPTMPLDYRLTESPMSQESIEIEQLSDFLGRARSVGAVGETESIEWVSDDPPDVRIKLVGRPVINVELTSLTTTDISRQRLGEMRKLARAVEQKISADSGSFDHLKGRRVAITDRTSDGTRPPRLLGHKFDALVDEVVSVLRQDIGYAQGYPTKPDGTPSAGVPTSVVEQGHSSVRDYAIDVYAAGLKAPTSIIANAQLELYLDDLQAKLISTIAGKDIASNDVLLISTGLIDNRGFVVGADTAVYFLARKLAQRGLGIAPKHLNQIVLHRWGWPDATLLFQRPGAPVLIESSAWPGL